MDRDLNTWPHRPGRLMLLTFSAVSLGMMPQFEKLADPSDDVVGLVLDLDELPERVRVSKGNP